MEIKINKQGEEVIMDKLDKDRLEAAKAKFKAARTEYNAAWAKAAKASCAELDAAWDECEVAVAKYDAARTEFNAASAVFAVAV